MRLGCCGSMIAPTVDPVGIAIVETLAEIGFDYIELSMADTAALPEGEFSEVAKRVRNSGISCESFNNFFPPAVRLTGADARLNVTLEYAGRAIDRAAGLGAKVIVFGSALAKNVPAGFSHEIAWKQIVELLQNMGPMAGRQGITLAIEPVNRGESNIINLTAEGLRLMREVGHPSIQLLVDYYHLMKEAEDPRVIAGAGPALAHTHFARIEGRGFPTEPDDGYATFFNCLRRIGYSQRCSIEAYTTDFANDARRALGVLRQLSDSEETKMNAKTQR